MHNAVCNRDVTLDVLELTAEGGSEGKMKSPLGRSRSDLVLCTSTAHVHVHVLDMLTRHGLTQSADEGTLVLVRVRV